MKNKVEITKNEYLALVRAVVVARNIYSELHEFDDERYHVDTIAMGRVETLLAKAAALFQAEDLLADNLLCECGMEHEMEDQKDQDSESPSFSVLSPLYNKLLGDLDDFEAHLADHHVAHELARRDVHKKLGRHGEIASADGKLSLELDTDQNAAAFFEQEERYLDEFAEHGYDRLEVREES